ncbi:hypothetical protein GCM10008931_31530 [Oceanobacillus oncorhynchi subsp. oncorhynchi]|uniref:hypothetical protein n=1 Tax=Oceanobacillus oncorhynchi TaxID=545501 RepID=UPI0031CF04C2
MFIMLLGACSIGSGDNSNEKAGFLSEMKEIDDKVGKDEEDEIDYDDTAENEVLIDLALEEFKKESENMREFSDTKFENLTIEDLQSVTDIQIWKNKYIYIKVNAENENKAFSSGFEKYYKYEEGELIDSEYYDDSSSAFNPVLKSEETNLLNDTPDYEEKSDNVLDLTKTYE